MEQLPAQASKALSEASSEVRAKSASELADEFGVSSRTIQGWFKVILQAYVWIGETELKTGSSAKTRYTPYCQKLIAEFRQASEDMSAEDWITSIHEQNPNLLPVPEEELPVSPTKVFEGEFSEGLTLHIGSSPSLPPVSSPVPVANDAAYLAMQEQRLAAFEAQQRQALEHMQQQFQRTQALNAQYREAMSLSDQLLLQEYQLRGVQLGYSALQTKHEAFKATVQAAEAGTLPGKPQPGEEPPVQSA
ncbi:hypothetical protein [Sphaerothrix gracilis]|uniref:hypothetical protein n=1 Tax=Sphaerothrix gracilis TaxID=3151835 RepID=UPI0031FD5CDA